MRQSDTQPPVGDRLATYVMSAVDAPRADYCSLRGRISNSQRFGARDALASDVGFRPRSLHETASAGQSFVSAIWGALVLPIGDVECTSGEAAVANGISYGDSYQKPPSQCPRRGPGPD